MKTTLGKCWPRPSEDNNEEVFFPDKVKKKICVCPDQVKTIKEKCFPRASEDDKKEVFAQTK